MGLRYQWDEFVYKPSMCSTRSDGHEYIIHMEQWYKFGCDVEFWPRVFTYWLLYQTKTKLVVGVRRTTKCNQICSHLSFATLSPICIYVSIEFVLLLLHFQCFHTLECLDLFESISIPFHSYNSKCVQVKQFILSLNNNNNIEPTLFLRSFVA